VVLLSFVIGRNQSYLNLWAITGDPWYKTPIVALEPTVERAVRAVHSTGGRIDTHLLLWVPSRVLEVRLWG
jgi:hypothetical protein